MVFKKAFLTTIFLILISSFCFAQTHSFLPLLKDHTFYLLKAEGSQGLIIDRWKLSGSLLSKDIPALLRSYRQGHLPLPERKIFHRNTSDIQSYYALGASHPASTSLNGLTQKEASTQASSLFIAHEKGIDEVNLDHLLEAPQKIEINSFQELPFATGIVFLKSTFKNELKITSQYDPSKKESTLSLFLDDSTLLNQWNSNIP